MIKAKITGGQLTISFPHVASGQAVISAIAIATLDKNLKPASSPEAIFKLADKNLSVEDWLDLGDPQFFNQKANFSSLPPELFGAEWLKASAISRPFETSTIELTRDADVFVCVDTLSNKPSWIKDFAGTNSFVQNDRGNVYRVYKKRFLKGELIKLNEQAIENIEKYLIMAQSASNIEPAYDLKTVSSYKAVDAKWQGPGIVKGQVDGKDRIIFQRASQQNVLEWNFSVGVADRYSLTISYNNSGTETIKGNLQLTADDGNLLKEEKVDFTPTKPGKSNYIDTNSGSMINAGNYKLRLTSSDATGLSINSLDVQ